MIRRSLLALLFLDCSGGAATGQDGLKVYISADMEGVVGAVTGDQLGPGGFEYQRFRQIMTDEVRAALGRLDDFEPYTMDGPVELEISFKNYMPAEVMAYLPNVDRVDAHTIRFVGQDMTEVSRFIAFTTRYRVDITP